MAIVHGQFTTYDAEFLADDIRGFATRVEPRFTIAWDLIPDMEQGTSAKLTWFDKVRNALEGAVRGSAWDGSATTGLGIDDQLAVIVQIGDILQVEDEQVIVSGVTSRASSSGEITVFERGHGGTTPAVHADTTAIKIVGNAQREGRVDIDGLTEDTVERTNFYSLVEEQAKISVKAKNQDYKDIENRMDSEREDAVIRALKKIGLSVIFGFPNEGSKLIPSSCGGFQHFLKDASLGAAQFDQSGPFTEDGLKEILKAVATRGGSTTHVLMSLANKAIANNFNSAITQTDRRDTQAGAVVNTFLDDNAGVVLLVGDLNMPDDVIYTLNQRKLRKAWFRDDTLRFVEETNTSSREVAETLQGQYSIMVKDIATDHGALIGITP